VVTFNKRDFLLNRRFEVECLTPREFLMLAEELP
jgi:hypothetical protein